MLQRLLKRIETLMGRKFFGTVTLTFQNGVLHVMKVEETFKPDDL